MATEVQKESEKKIYRLSEVEEHKERGSCWLIIHNNVYDVTGFLDEVGFQGVQVVLVILIISKKLYLMTIIFMI